MESDLLTRLYERYANDVFRYVRYSIGNREDALDVLQEVFIKAQQSIQDFKHESSPKTWLITIARHTVADFFRVKKRSERSLNRLGAEPALQMDTMSSIPDRMDVENALQGLPEKDREVFVMRHVLGFSVKEAAAAMGWSEVRVRVKLHRVNKRLRLLLDGTEAEGGTENVGLH